MTDNGGADSASAQPLLADPEELAGAWNPDPDVEGEAHNIRDGCTVKEMFKEHAHGVLRYLQTAGIEKIGEFTADDDLVFAAFEDSTLLTFGSEERHINAEQEWRRELQLRRKKRMSPVKERDDNAGWTRQDEDLSLPLSEILQTTRGRVTVIAEIIALLCMAPFLALEGGTLLAYGWGWLRDPTNLLDICTYTLQILVSVTHLGRLWVASHWLTYLLAVQCILLMFRLQYFTQCIRATRFSFSSMIRGVLMDIGWVLVFVVLVCVGYGAAIHITFRQDKDAPPEYDSFPKAVFDMIEHAYGDLELKKFYGSKNPVFATLLALSYMLIMGYVIINLVLGLVIQSLDRLTAHDDAKQLLNQARAIDEVESLMPAWYEHRHKKRWHPNYVHILRIDPEKLDSVVLDALWTQHGQFAPVMPRRSRGALNAEGGGGGGGASDTDGFGSGGEEGEGWEKKGKKQGGAGEKKGGQKEGKAVEEELKELKEVVLRQEKMLEEVLRKVREGGESKGKEGGEQWGEA